MQEHIKREKEFDNYITTAHMLCFLLLMLAIILSDRITGEGYLFFRTRLFAILLLVSLGSILLYNAKKRFPTRGSVVISWIDLVYIAIPTLVSGIIVFALGPSLNYAEVVLVLPVLVAASVLGRAAGLMMSSLCTVLVLMFVTVNGQDSLLEAVESNLIMIGLLYLVGWFIGALADMEKEHREQLGKSLLSLKKEIAVRKKVEEKLSLISCAVEQGPAIVIIADTEGNVEYVNHKFTQAAGYLSEEVKGRGISILGGATEENYRQITNLLINSNAGEWRGECINNKKNGDIFWESVTISPFKNIEGSVTHFLRLSEDITHRKNMELEMTRLDRLNIVGEMAAGIGHEIRNPMTSVRGFLQLLGEKKECQKFRDYFKLMIEELDRANSIITGFLSLAKNKAIDIEPCRLNQLVEEITPLIQADAIIADKYVKTELLDVPPLLLDKKEIRQMLLNLVRNGLDAVPAGRNVTVKTCCRGSDVILLVQDEGNGIKPELLDKIGTPFFTTKDNGTGLGLAVCYSIAARHSANIGVETSPGGTTFTVSFINKGM